MILFVHPDLKTQADEAMHCTRPAPIPPKFTVKRTNEESKPSKSKPE